MALIACSECGRQVSDRAAACPSCGNPTTSQAASVALNGVPVLSTKTPAKEYSKTEWAISWLLAAAIPISAFVFNPTAAAHRDQIRRAVADREPIASFFGAGHLIALDTQYHSLALFSYTTFNRQTVSVGAFGIVLIVAK